MNRKIAGSVFVFVILVVTGCFVQAAEEVGKKGTNIGDEFLNYNDFKAKTLDGKEITTKDFKDKYVFIDFWATWCPPCKEEIPYLSRVEEKLIGEKFMILGISLDSDIDKIPPFEKEYNISYPQSCDGLGWKSPWVAAYGIKGIPTNYLLDTGGKIVAKNLRGYQVEAKVAKGLGKESVAIHFVEADSLLRSGKDKERLDKAKVEIEKALKLEPENPKAHLTMGSILLEQEKAKEAKEWFEKGLKFADKAVEQGMLLWLRTGLSNAYAQEGDWDGVITEYDKMDAEVEGVMKLSLKAGLLGLLVDKEQNELALEHGRALMKLLDEQPEEIKNIRGFSQFKSGIMKEVEKLEAAAK